MRKAGIDAEISDAIERVIWEKFVFLVGLSATTTYLRTTLGPVREDPGSRELLLNIMRETVAVGRAQGIDLPAGLCRRPDSPSPTGFPIDMTSSMHHDLENENPLELAWLSGAVVRFGAELGIATPTNQTVYAALEPYAEPVP